MRVVGFAGGSLVFHRIDEDRGVHEVARSRVLAGRGWEAGELLVGDVVEFPVV
jgi:hypothetical protein